MVNEVRLTPDSYSQLLTPNYGNKADLLFGVPDCRPKVERRCSGVGDDWRLPRYLALLRWHHVACQPVVDPLDRLVYFSACAIGNQFQWHYQVNTGTKMVYSLERYSCLSNPVQWSIVVRTTRAVSFGSVLRLFPSGPTGAYDRSPISFPPLYRGMKHQETMDYTPYQTEIIKRYYKNREESSAQKLAELTTDLYLAEGKKRQQIWKRVAAALSHLGVEPGKIEQMVNADNPVKLAEFVKKLS